MKSEADAGDRGGEIGELLWAQTTYSRNSNSGEWNYYVDEEGTPENTDWQRWLGTAPKRAHQPPIVVIGDLAGAMVELELLERGKRSVALLCQGKPALLELVRPVEMVVSRARLPQERQRHQHHARHRQNGADDEGDGHMRTAASA